ncbi:MAG: hypothetical protein SGJ00_11025 [bacterium]|nr:hypothetical protein [bacterium]
MGAYRHQQVFDNDSYQYALEVAFQLDTYREYIKLTEKTVENDIKAKIIAFLQILERSK